MAFSADELNELQAVFELIDKDKTGVVPTKDVGTILRAAGANPSE